jgi:integrase
MWNFGAGPVGVYRTPERVALKSAYARREVPLTQAMAEALRELRPDDPRAAQGPRVRRPPRPPAGLHHRLPPRLGPGAQGGGARLGGIHALRHTTASLVIAEGRSPVQIAAWLGHHSPACSMAVYGHLMDDGVGEGLHLASPVVAA